MKRIIHGILISIALIVGLQAQNDIEAISSGDNKMEWAYYFKKDDTGKPRWFITSTNNSKSRDVYSLMPIKEGKPGWGKVGKSVAIVDLENNTISIDNIADNPSFKYYDAGWREKTSNPKIQDDIELIRNSTVDIRWWFFRASNGFWFIINKNASIYKFSKTADGVDYDWKEVDTSSVEFEFYIDEDGIKKMRIKQTPELSTAIIIDMKEVTSDKSVVGSDFNFNVTLSEPLSKGSSVYLNFDNLADGWFKEIDDGGHFKMDCNNTECSLTKSIKVEGDRKVRAGIFKDGTLDIIGEYFDYKEFIVNQTETLVENIDMTNAFITTWNVLTNVIGGGASYKLGINADSNYNYNYNIDWGDGTIEKNIKGDKEHYYDLGGIYTVKIIGKFPTIKTFSDGDADILTIEQWGNIEWKSFKDSFSRCKYLTIAATDKPNISNVTDMSFMFEGDTILNSSLNDWDVSNVTNMQGMFYNASSFNYPLDSWNVSNVTDMSYMFANASSFNQPLDSWDVSNVTDMDSMLKGASSFGRVEDSKRSIAKKSTDKYDAMLNNWSQLDLQKNVKLGANNLTYSSGIKSARKILVDDYKWDIEDSGLAKDDETSKDDGNSKDDETSKDDGISKDDEATEKETDNILDDKDSNLHKPVANAGENRYIIEGDEEARLDASNSFDSDGKIVTYKWEQISGVKVELKIVHTNIPSYFKFQVPKMEKNGKLKFRLTVTDNDNLTSYDEIILTVKHYENTIVDNSTNLMWQNNKDENKINLPWVTKSNYNAKNYNDTSGDTATSYCQNLVLDDYSNWRLPTLKELKTAKAIKDRFIRLSYSAYWTSDSFIGGSTVEDYQYAWIVGFYASNDGNIPKNSLSSVKCVRDFNSEDSKPQIKVISPLSDGQIIDTNRLGGFILQVRAMDDIRMSAIGYNIYNINGNNQNLSYESKNLTGTSIIEAYAMPILALKKGEHYKVVFYAKDSKGQISDNVDFYFSIKADELVNVVDNKPIIRVTYPSSDGQVIDKKKLGGFAIKVKATDDIKVSSIGYIIYDIDGKNQNLSDESRNLNGTSITEAYAMPIKKLKAGEDYRVEFYSKDSKGQVSDTIDFYFSIKDVEEDKKEESKQEEYSCDFIDIDVSDNTQWWAEYVITLCKAGIVHGNIETNEYLPDRSATWAEIVKVAENVSDLDRTTNYCNTSQYDNQEWSACYMAFAGARGFTQNKELTKVRRGTALQYFAQSFFWEKENKKYTMKEGVFLLNSKGIITGGIDKNGNLDWDYINVNMNRKELAKVGAKLLELKD